MPLSLYPQKQTTGDNLPFADTQNSITEDKNKDSKEEKKKKKTKTNILLFGFYF